MKTAASVMEAADLLCTDVDCILGGNLMAVCDTVCSVECKGSYGPILFDHLAADGAGFTGGQVAVGCSYYTSFVSPAGCHLLVPGEGLEGGFLAGRVVEGERGERRRDRALRKFALAANLMES